MFGRRVVAVALFLARMATSDVSSGDVSSGDEGSGAASGPPLDLPPPPPDAPDNDFLDSGFGSGEFNVEPPYLPPPGFPPNSPTPSKPPNLPPKSPSPLMPPPDLPPPSTPPPSPDTPPPPSWPLLMFDPEAPTNVRTTVTLEASGDVSDYTPQVIFPIGAKFAAQAGVRPEQVEVVVSAGSVLITVTIVSSAEAAELVRGRVESVMSNATMASAFLSDVPGITISVLAISELASPPPEGPSSVPSYAPSSPLIMLTTNASNSSNFSNSSAELSDLSVDHAVSQEQRQIVLAISLSIVVTCCCVAALFGASCQKWAAYRSKVAAVAVAPASPVLVGAIGAVRPSRAKEMAEAAFQMQQRPSPSVPSYGGLNWTPEMLEAARRLEVPGMSYQP